MTTIQSRRSRKSCSLLAIGALATGLTLVGHQAAQATSEPVTPTLRVPTPTTCDAVVGEPCDSSLGTAYTRWQANLPALLAADLGVFSPALNQYPQGQTIKSALMACTDIAGAAAHPVDGENAWFDMQGTLHPQLLLSESHKLFDASMAVLCPELGYTRGYNWQGTGETQGEGGTSNTMPGGLPQLPGWQFVDCADALGDLCSDPVVRAAYDRWGFKLPMMYSDPDTGYPGPAMGWFEGQTDYTEFNRLVLTACQAAFNADNAGTPDAENQWYTATATIYPAAPASVIRALFYASVVLVCPDIQYIPAT